MKSLFADSFSQQTAASREQWFWELRRLHKCQTVSCRYMWSGWEMHRQGEFVVRSGHRSRSRAVFACRLQRASLTCHGGKIYKRPIPLPPLQSLFAKWGEKLSLHCAVTSCCSFPNLLALALILQTHMCISFKLEANASIHQLPEVMHVCKHLQDWRPCFSIL